jgi:hypothetical protein
MILLLKKQCAKGSEIVGFSPAKPWIEVLRRECPGAGRLKVCGEGLVTDGLIVMTVII